MRQSGYERKTIERHEEFNAHLNAFFEHPVVEYNRVELVGSLCPKGVEGVRVPEIRGVARHDCCAVPDRDRVNETVPKRLWLALDLIGVLQPSPGSRRLRIPVHD